ncbi:hypothetical protein A2U01_0077878, partial [Trifolium medium]|nr:hypothetical protein [Trifolium medium]
MEFTEWWNKYYSSRSMGDEALISRLESGFNQLQIENIKSKVKTR